MEAKYDVAIIEEGCFGDTLASFGTLAGAKEWIDGSGVAYEHYYGVAIYDVEQDLWDIGHDEWLTEDECWAGEGE